MKATMTQQEFSKLTDIMAASLTTMRKAGRFGNHFKAKGNRIFYDVVPALTHALNDIDRGLGRTQANVYDKIEAALSKYQAEKTKQPPPDILPEPTTIAEANKQKLIYQAKLGRLKYEKEKGVLVEKEAVYRDLFRKGKELREAMLAIPDRVIDEIRSKSSRQAAHKCLTDAIHEALTRMSSENSDNE